MKKIKFQRKAAFIAGILAAAALLTSASIASAQSLLIGAQFVENSASGTNGSGIPGALYTGMGELGESFVAFSGPGDVNYPTSGYTGGTEALGTSGVSLTVTPTSVSGDTAAFSNNGTGGNANNLFSSFLAAHNSGFNFTLSGLTAGNTYDLALYAGDLGIRSGDNPESFIINGAAAPFTVGPTNGGGSFIAQTATQTGNFEIVDNVVADSMGDINIVSPAVTSGNDGNYIEFNGIGIESVTAAPEPSVWASMLLGAGALMGVQAFRRRNA